MFYNQPLAHRFGKALADDIESGRWNRLEFAVAWVRRSGTQHLGPSVQKFLRDGGVAQVTVGVDIENTSQEGLTDLLSWESSGQIETFIYHNELDATFHPKVYLLRNDADARLIVGSNNLTEAGLYVNSEAGLQLDAPLADPLILQARAALAAWRSVSTGMVRKLDPTLLNDLVLLGYVSSEKALEQRRGASAQHSKGKRRKPGQALFGGVRITRPPVPAAPTTVRGPPLTAYAPGTVLLMRVRKARGTQVQMPFQVVRTDFFEGVGGIVSEHDSRPHGLHPARAGGKLNTMKVEIPETTTMNDPVLRLERTLSGISYRAFDANSDLGTPIRQALLNGFAMSPPATFKTIPDLATATWWRFI